MTQKDYTLNPEFVPPEEPQENKNVPFFQMFRYATGLDKFLIFLGLLFSGLAGIVQPLNPLIYGTLTGHIIQYAVIKNSDAPEEVKQNATTEFLDNVRDFAIKNSLIGLAMLFFGYAATVTFNYSAFRQIFKIRSTYLNRVLNQDIPWYDVHQTGDFASRMSDDLSKFEDGIGEKIPMYFSFITIFIGSTVISLIKGWELALVCFTPFPATLVVMLGIGWLTTNMAKKELDAYGSAGAIAEEVLTSIRTVAAFGGQKKEEDRYNSYLGVARDNNIRRAIFSGMSWGFLWIVIFGSYALSFWYGVKLVIEQRDDPDPVYTPGNMVTVFFSVMSGFQSFGASAPYIEAFGISKAAASKIFSVIDSEPVINNSKGKGDKIENAKGNIKFKAVQFHYPSRKDVQILKKLDLDITSGQTVALVGSSGCGKSTVIQLLQRFYDPVSGVIEIDGFNVKDLDLKWLRSIIGVVGQEPVLFGTTIKENIKYGNLEATEDDIIRAAKKSNAHKFIKALPNGYNTLVGERGAQLSGGQKQRIAIARALVRNPAILLLDEATSALDNTSEAKVQAALDNASEECTTIIVAHRLSTIRNANKIIVLSQGQVVEQGTHEELMALKSEYYNLVMAQVKGSDAVESVRGKKVVAVDDDEDDTVPQQEMPNEEIVDDINKKPLSLSGLLKMNAPEWPYIVAAVVTSSVVGCGLPLFAVLFGSIIGVLSSTDNDYVTNEANKFCMYMAIMGLILMCSAFLQFYTLGVAGERLTERLRRLMFKSMLSLEMGYFDSKENGVGALCSRLSTDAASVQGATGQRVGTIVQSLATLLTAVTFAMYYEWKLGLVALSFMPVQLTAIFVERRNTSGQNDTKGQTLEKSTKLAVESISNIRTVASLGLEETFQNIYLGELIPYYQKSLRAVHARGFVYGLSRGIMFFAYSACMYYGGFLIRDGLEYEKVFKISQALMLSTGSIANSLAFTPNLNRGLEAARNIRNFLRKVPAIRDHITATDLKGVNSNILYSDVRFSYPTRPGIPVLKGLNLDIIQGKTVALVGPSGCGKSTIIQLIERFYDPNSGNVLIDNSDIKSVKLTSLRSFMGIVSQEPNLFSKTIGENIAYGDNAREVSQTEIIEAAKNANIHSFIVSLPMGYETKLGEKGTQLSGGQKQRIAIARALVRNPRILLLDEATSALDTESEKVVQEALDKAKVGRTCITIAHRLTTIQDADLICVINEGKVVEQGTHEELLKRNGLYFQLQSQ